jgi:hypothetical protein
VWFGRPIKPRRLIGSTEDIDPPLDQDELPGLLTAWQRREDGSWWAMVSYPTRCTG